MGDNCFRVGTFALCPIREVLEQVWLAHSLGCSDFKVMAGGEVEGPRRWVPPLGLKEDFRL